MQHCLGEVAVQTDLAYRMIKEKYVMFLNGSHPSLLIYWKLILRVGNMANVGGGR